MTIAVLEMLTFGLGRLVAAADAAGERLCLLTAHRGIYHHELAQLAPDALEVIDVDTHDVAACAEVLKAVPDVRGLISSTDTWMLPGAELAARLGLPGPDLAAARALRDKLGVRVLLHEQGLSRGSPWPPSVRCYRPYCSPSGGHRPRGPPKPKSADRNRASCEGPMTPADALAAAGELAERLRADAAERDRANRPPIREIDLLRDSGLLALPPYDHVTAHAGELPPFTSYS